MIEDILLCLAASPIVLCMWSIAIAMADSALKLIKSPKFNAKKIKAHCEQHIGCLECKGCYFLEKDGDCGVSKKLPFEWEV